MFDIFFVGPDELAKRYNIVNGCFSLRDKERFLTNQELEQTIAVLNSVDCKTNAQGTLFANKELDEYKVNYMVAMLDNWRHTTVILQTDQEPATMSIAHAVRDRRAKSTIVRGSPAYSCELDVYSDSTAGRGMCQRTGVGKVRHLELRFLWIQERLRLKAFRLNKETTEEMTADILTKYCERPKIEHHCATLNLRFPLKGLGSLMVAGFLVHCANADVEKVSGEASLETVNPVTDSQVWQGILVV